jgi:hypothetical protein
LKDLNGEAITGTFYEQEMQKSNQDTFRIEKVLKTKGDKIFVKWMGYSDDFNSWIDKKDYRFLNISHKNPAQERIKKNWKKNLNRSIKLTPS